MLNRKEVFGLVLHWYITFNTPQQIVQPQNVHRHTTFIYAFLADTLHHAVSVQDLSPVMLVLNFHVSCFSQCRTQAPVLSLTTHTWLEFHPCIKRKFPNGKSYEKFFVLRSWSHRKKFLGRWFDFFVFIWLIFFFPFLSVPNIKSEFKKLLFLFPVDKVLSSGLYVQLDFLLKSKIGPQIE